MNDLEVLNSDIVELMQVLGIHANKRPVSTHMLFQDLILPEVRELQQRLRATEDLLRISANPGGSHYY